MAALCLGPDFTVVSLFNGSIVFKGSDLICTEIVLKQENSFCEDNFDNDGTLPTVSSALSPSGEFFACFVNKNLYVWSTKDWSLQRNILLNRSASSITFSFSNDKIAVADKSGDVYLYSIENVLENGELLLGHVSMLLDILITPDNKYIITCDRDEKIRVSCFPNAYNIQSFCLGHEEFVTSLNILPHDNYLLISGGGDGTLRIWDYREGKQLLSYECKECQDDKTGDKPVLTKLMSMKTTHTSSIICIQIVSFKGILVYNIIGNSRNCSCQFVQIISMDFEPWCFYLGTNKNLFILKRNCMNCLASFNFDFESLKFTESSRVSLGLLEKCLSKYSSNLEKIFEKDSHINSLYKRRFDNVQQYLKRKLERTENKLKKNKDVNSNSS